MPQQHEVGESERNGAVQAADGRRESAQSAAGQGGWAVPLAVLIAGMFMSVLDITIVNVAIPTMQNDFGVDVDEIQWVTTAYSLALGVVVPATAWLGDRIGLARLYNWSLVTFAAASALCGLAWDVSSMVVFRILQAVPGGILPVITLVMVYRIVPREKIGTAMGMYGIGIIFAPAIGPTLGGYLVEYVDWRLIFFVNVPVGVLGAVVGFLMLPDFPKARVHRFDGLGFVTIAYGLAALLLALTEGQDWGWTSYPILGLLISATLSLALFVVIELEVEQPLLDVRVFRHWPFTNSVLLVVVLTAGLFVMLFYVPLFMQEGQDIQPLRTGLILLPEALVMGALMPVAGRVYDKIGPRWPAAIGLGIAAYGTYLLTGISPDMTEGDVILWTCVRAVGMGMSMMAIFTAGLAVLPPHQVNVGSAYNNVAQRVSASFAVAALTAMATAQQAQLLADRSTLVPANDPAAGPELTAMTEQGAVGILQLYQRTQLDVLAASYSDVFLVIAWLTAAGAVLALFMKRPPVPAVEATPSPDAAPSTSGHSPHDGETMAASQRDDSPRTDGADDLVPERPLARSTNPGT